MSPIDFLELCWEEEKEEKDEHTLKTRFISIVWVNSIFRMSQLNIHITLSAASGLSGFLSGWYLSASFRYVFLISSGVAVLERPKISYKVSPEVLLWNKMEKKRKFLALFYACVDATLSENINRKKSMLEWNADKIWIVIRLEFLRHQQVVAMNVFFLSTEINNHYCWKMCNAHMRFGLKFQQSRLQQYATNCDCGFLICCMSYAMNMCNCVKHLRFAYPESKWNEIPLLSGSFQLFSMLVMRPIHNTCVSVEYAEN